MALQNGCSQIEALTLSDLMANVCRLLDVKKVNMLGYHPQTDGLVERFHQTLITMLSKYVQKHSQDWDYYPLHEGMDTHRVTSSDREKVMDTHLGHAQLL